MTATIDTRKRSREEDGSDSMPLSKRINNLHINNHQSQAGNQQAHDDDAAMGFHSQQFQQQQQQQQQHHQHHINHLSPQPSGSNGSASYMQGQQLATADQQQQQQQLHMHQHQLQMQQQQQHLHQQHAMLFHQQQSPADSGHSSNHSSNSGSSFDHHLQPGGYEPELNNSENPFYYDKNKLLYDLHAERLRRNH